MTRINRACPVCGMKIARWKFMLASPLRFRLTTCEGCATQLAYKTAFIAWLVLIASLMTFALVGELDGGPRPWVFAIGLGTLAFVLPPLLPQVYTVDEAREL
ncbi:hypothetical protein FF098_012285 [Parvularcula flava]|uniref:Uncharacterized protein n=1 Tax=Aquisalinus luteolus TaxID=1566827 RepID=A0A8J3ERK7_9PROT|nr:hypothetical protein [Aquisalinus luteolus]NHK28689.1 hypothetical protein [Aquisalinus luteolus]GGH99223.1 hypothetical protein GCM10011355_24670 [Aquisalinus luteolus]